MKILVIDNYDSFTYNLVYLLKQYTKQSIDVFRNDCIDLEKVNEYDKIVISPGPKLPQKAGVLMDIIEHYKEKKSILGICLGMQGIGINFDYQLRNLSSPFHGIQDHIQLNTEHKIFNGLSISEPVGRYHSWVVDPPENSELKTIAWDKQGNSMAVVHSNLPIVGLQFHPESILTPNGYKMIENWINYF